MVVRTIRDLGIPAVQAAIYDGPAYAPKENLIAFHRLQYESGACSVAFTGVEAVAHELTRLGVPNEWSAPSDQDIVVSLERALLSTASRREGKARSWSG